MSDLLRGLAGLRSAAEKIARGRARMATEKIAGDPELGQTFHEGDVVRDPETGLEGRVARVEVRHVVVPTARGEGS